MVKDRLPELLSHRKTSQRGRRKVKGDTFELDNLFFEKTNELHRTIEELTQHVSEVELTHRDILASPKNNPKLDERLDHLNRIIREKTAYVQATLKALECDSHEKQPLVQSIQDRMKQSQHAAMMKNFYDVLHLYNQYQLDYRDKCKSRIYQKLAIAGYTFSERQVEDMLEKKNAEIFTQAVMAETEAAKRSLSDIEARHADLLRLEESIKELQELFITLGTMVEQQSQLVDRIEDNVNKATNCVASANQQLVEAERSQKKSRRCRIILISVGVVVGLLLLVTILSAIGLT